MYSNNESYLVWSVSLVLVSFALFVMIGLQVIYPIRVQEILAFAIIGTTAAVIALVGSGASLQKWLKNKENLKMAMIIFQAFAKNGVIEADKIKVEAQMSFDRLKSEGVLKGSFDKKKKEKFDETMQRLRFEGYICVDTKGTYFWWKHTYSDPPI